MKGTRILVTASPRGVFEDVFITGTPKPGSLMEITPSTEPIGNVFNYSLAGTTGDSGGHYMAEDGDKKCIAILLEKDTENKIWDDAYQDGDMGRIYYPYAGEQFNMRIGDVSGTGDDYVIGTELMIDENTNIGMLIEADADAEAHPFTILEASTDVEAEWMAHCRFNGAAAA